MIQKKATNITFKLIFFFLFTIGSLLVFYLSWKTNPNVGELSYVPAWLAHWADEVHNNRMRTAVPFVFLGLLYGIYLVLLKIPNLKSWLLGWVLLSGIVLLAEWGQYFLPSRSPDFKDVLWGIFGAAAGLGLMYLLSKSYHLLKK